MWKQYFSEKELLGIKSHNLKKLIELPSNLQAFINSLKDSSDIDTLKAKLDQEQNSPACEWVKYTILDFLALFKCRYLPLTDQLEGDMMRRVWRFIDTAFDDSNITCRGYGIHICNLDYSCLY